MRFALTDDIHFPPVSMTGRDKYIAVGGDLSPERIVEAYSNGIFPFNAFREEILTWCRPLDRFVIFPDEIHISHSMRNLFNKGEYRVTFNEAFDRVIENCSQLRIHERYAWLGGEVVEAYKKLNKLGIAKSVETWCGDELIGGLYGIELKNAFFGESMFSLAPSGSKASLIALAQKLKAEGGKFIDCQFETAHLKSMGGRHISYEEYMKILNNE